MAKKSSTCNSNIFFGLVLLLLASCTAIVSVQGQCTEKFGACDPADKCQSTCASRHPGGKSTCDTSVNPPACICNFDCSKHCEEDIDLGFPCDNPEKAEACDRACVERHGGEAGSQGHCFSHDTTSKCICEYNC